MKSWRCILGRHQYCKVELNKKELEQIEVMLYQYQIERAACLCLRRKELFVRDFRIELPVSVMKCVRCGYIKIDMKQCIKESK